MNKNLITPAVPNQDSQDMDDLRIVEYLNLATLPEPLQKMLSQAAAPTPPSRPRRSRCTRESKKIKKELRLGVSLNLFVSPFSSARFACSFPPFHRGNIIPFPLRSRAPVSPVSSGEHHGRNRRRQRSPIGLSVGLAPRQPSLFGLPSQGNPPGRYYLL